MLRFDAVSVVPEVFDSYISASIVGNALKKGLFEFHAHNLHDWGLGDYQKVDDAPFGGGQGQLMMCEPVFRAVEEIAQAGEKPHVVFFSPCGKPYTQKDAERLAGMGRILFVCTRYEGIDERAYSLADDVFSLGDYVLTGGELAALAVVDSVVRLIPGALGNDQSARDESFGAPGLLEYAQYTRPASFRGMEVPEVLRSGNHAKVADWKRRNAIERTALRRPDLLAAADLTDDERAYAEAIASQD